VLEDGRLIEVRAKPEPLFEVRAHDAQQLARLAWHLGNRHVPASIAPDRILIRPDHVIAGMLVGLGGRISAVEAPFDPEPGAYSHQAGSQHRSPGGHKHAGHA
jgi:urease accessory protein